MEFKLLRLLYGLLFFVTPLLIVPTTSELFEFNKMMFIYTIASLSLFLFAVRALRSKSWIISRTYFTVPLALFLTAQTLSVLFSIDRHTSLIGYYGRFNGGLLSLFSFAVLSVIAASFFTRDDVKKVLKISLISSAFVIAWGIPSKFGLDFTCWLFTHKLNASCWTDQFRPAERLFSTLGQPNWLGSYLAIQLFFACIFLIWYTVKKQRKQRLFTAAYILFNIVTILFTKSRSSLLAVGVSGSVFIVMAALYRPARELAGSYKKQLFILAAIIVALIFNEYVGLDWIKAPKQTVQINSQTGANPAPPLVTDSLDIRKVVWKGAVDLGLKYPLLGTGPETFAYGYYFVRPVQHNATSEWDFIYNKAHNEFLNYFATTGFAGLIGYLIFSVSVYIFLIKKFLELKSERKPTNSTTQDAAFYTGLTAALTTVHITNFFGFSTSTVNLAFFLIPAFAYAYGRKSEISVKQTKLTRSGIAGIMAVSAASLYALIWLASFHIADVKYAEANELYAQGEYYQATGKLQEALRLHHEHLYEDKLSSTLANIALISPFQDGDKNKPEDYISVSDALNLKTLKASPQNVQYWKTRGKNHYLYYQSTLDLKYLDEAIRAIDTAQKLAPTDPKYPYTQALFYSLRADEEQDSVRKKKFEWDALNNISEAALLKPDYIDARVLMIKLTDKYGMKERAAELRAQFGKEFPYATQEAE